jgi:hypothetical protein
MATFVSKLLAVHVKGVLVLMGMLCEERLEVVLEELVRRLRVRKVQTEPESEEHHADRNKFDPSRNRPPDHTASGLHTTGGGRGQYTEDSRADSSSSTEGGRLQPPDYEAAVAKTGAKRGSQENLQPPPASNGKQRSGSGVVDGTVVVYKTPPGIPPLPPVYVSPRKSIKRPKGFSISQAAGEGKEIQDSTEAISAGSQVEYRRAQ